MTTHQFPMRNTSDFCLYRWMGKRFNDRNTRVTVSTLVCFSIRLKELVIFLTKGVFSVEFHWLTSKKSAQCSVFQVYPDFGNGWYFLQSIEIINMTALLFYKLLPLENLFFIFRPPPRGVFYGGGEKWTMLKWELLPPDICLNRILLY